MGGQGTKASALYNTNGNTFVNEALHNSVSGGTPRYPQPVIHLSSLAPPGGGQGGFATGPQCGSKISILPWRLQTFPGLTHEQDPFLPGLPEPSLIMFTKTVYVPVLQDTF